MNKFQPQLFWVDLEMSGLNPFKNRILEFACILTDSSMNHKSEGPHYIIHCDKQHLKTMDEWNTKHHTQSGLYASCLDSKISIEQAEKNILAFLKQNGVFPGKLIIAGNSVHHDKVFLSHYMPKLNEFLHYRILDVSSIKIVVNTKLPKLFYKKQNKHRAIQDINESIQELKYYMKYAFK